MLLIHTYIIMWSTQTNTCVSVSGGILQVLSHKTWKQLRVPTSGPGALSNSVSESHQHWLSDVHGPNLLWYKIREVCESPTGTPQSGWMMWFTSSHTQAETGPGGPRARAPDFTCKMSLNTCSCWGGGVFHTRWQQLLIQQCSFQQHRLWTITTSEPTERAEYWGYDDDDDYSVVSTRSWIYCVRFSYSLQTENFNIHTNRSHNVIFNSYTTETQNGFINIASASEATEHQTSFK